MSVAVVSDSTHYIPREVVERHGIHTVSLYVTWDGRTEREAEMEDFGAFYEHLARASSLPGTSQPSNGDFLVAEDNAALTSATACAACGADL